MNQNAKDIKDIQDDRKVESHEDKITKKEIFVRIIRLELKMDHAQEENRVVRRQFRKYVFWLALLTLTDIIFSVLMVWLHWRELYGI